MPVPLLPIPNALAQACWARRGHPGWAILPLDTPTFERGCAHLHQASWQGRQSRHAMAGHACTAWGGMISEHAVPLTSMTCR